MSEINQLHDIDLHSGRITKPRWSRSGRFLAIPTESGSISIFDIDTGQIAQTFGCHSEEVTVVDWDHNERAILTASLDRSLGLWDPESGTRIPFAVSGHSEPVHSLEWTDEGAYVITCSSDRVRAWDGCCLLPGWSEEMEEGANQHSGFTAASCSSQTTLLLGIAAENGARLVLVSIQSGDLLDGIQMEQTIESLAWSPVEALLVVGTDESIVAFRATQEGFEGSARELIRGTPHVHALSFSADGTVLASSDAESLKIWDVRGARMIAALAENRDTDSNGPHFSGIAFHPDRPLLAAGFGTTFRILDLSDLG
jgi:WD40 repeat protein